MTALPPWHENLKKRQIKAPKVDLRDSGLLHALRPDAAYFWGTHGGAELDLLLMMRGKRYGVEFRSQDAPRLTPSMRTALDDLGLEHLTVLYPGGARYELERRGALDVPGGGIDCIARTDSAGGRRRWFQQGLRVGRGREIPDRATNSEKEPPCDR